MKNKFFLRVFNLFLLSGLILNSTYKTQAQTVLPEVQPYVQAGESPLCDLSQPARQRTYKLSKDIWSLTGSKWDLVLDSANPSLDSDDTWAMAVHREAAQVDEYFRNLASQGYGVWHGCYGGESGVAVMSSGVHYEDYTGYVGTYSDWLGGAAVFSDTHITKSVVAHEWAHSVVGSTLQLWSQGPESCGEGCKPGQAGALYEALADIFAAVITRNDNLESIEGMNRNLATPTIDHMDHYAELYSTDCPVVKEPQDRRDGQIKNRCKYVNLGIPSKAAYLLMTDGEKEHYGIKVKGIGRDKVGILLFHALNSNFYPTPVERNPGNYTFAQAAQGVLAACTDLAKPNSPAKGSFTSDDCFQVRQAFLAVGMLTAISSATALAVDVSGSMKDDDPGGGSKMDASKRALDTFLRMLRIENQAMLNANMVGLVTFTNSASIQTALTTDARQVEDLVRSLSPQQGTNIAQGLQVSIQQLDAHTDIPIRVIILLSDGIPTTSLDGSVYAYDRASYEQVRQEVLSGPVAQAAQSGYCIHVIGLGDVNQTAQLNDGTIVPSLDEDLLKQIAQGSGCGEYFLARNATELVKLYIKIRHASIGTVVAEADGVVQPNQTTSPVPFMVAAGQDMLFASVDHEGSKIELVLTDPQGRIVDASYPNAQLMSEDTLEILLVNSPTAGLWKLAVFGREVPSGGENYYSVVSTRGPKAPQRVVPQPSSGAPAAFVLAIVCSVALIGYTLIARKKKTTSKVSAPAAGFLLATSGIMAGTEFHLTPTFTIGRHSTCSLRLPDETVSRQHAVIRYSQGGWFIQDRNSKTGTYVNGQPVSAKRIENGDTIQIGNSYFIFKIK